MVRQTWEGSPAELLEHTDPAELLECADVADFLTLRKFLRHPEAMISDLPPVVRRAYSVPLIASARAILLRAQILVLMEKGNLLTEWTHDGELDEFVLRVMAQIPLKQMKPGVRYAGLHDYVLSEIRKAAAEKAN